MRNRTKTSLLRMISNVRNHIGHRDITIFAISVVLLTVALLALWPGLYTSDSYDQYNQAQTEIAYTAHPVFHTFTIWLVNLPHHSQAMLPLFQIFLFSLLWAGMCKYIRRLYGDGSKVFYVQVAFMAVLCLLPIIYTYSISAWKDVLYSYCLISLAFLLFVGSYKKFNYSTLQIVCISILLALTVAYRHNGIIPAVAILAVLLIGMMKYKVSIKKMIILVGLGAVFYALTIFTPHLFLEVRTSEGNPKTSVAMFYMAGFMNSDVKIDEQDQKILYKIMPKQYWLSDYYQYSYVPIGFSEHINHKAANEYTDQVFDMFLKYSLRYPEISAEHFFEVNNMAWNVYWPLEGPYKTTPGINAMPLSENSLADDAKTSKLGLMNDEMRLNINYTLNSTFMQTLFYRPALYMYLSIAIVAVLAYMTRSRRYWLLLLPMLFNLPAILIFGLTQDMRYLYINVLTFFLIGLIALVHLYDLRKKSN